MELRTTAIGILGTMCDGQRDPRSQAELQTHDRHQKDTVKLVVVSNGIAKTTVFVSSSIGRIVVGLQLTLVNNIHERTIIEQNCSTKNGCWFLKLNIRKPLKDIQDEYICICFLLMSLC